MIEEADAEHLRSLVEARPMVWEKNSDTYKDFDKSRIEGNMFGIDKSF
jgi:hypothetical protein